MEYKISKEAVDKVCPNKFKGYVEITDELDLELGKSSLPDLIWEAYKVSLKKDIRANTVMINKRLAEVKGFVHMFGATYGEMPPLICGLEAYVTDELPEEFAFGLVEAPKTKREQSYDEGYKAGYQDAMNKIREVLGDDG